MEVDELSPYERVIEQVSCEYNKSATSKTGVMIITNCRVLWKPSAEASFPVQIFRAPLHGHRGLQVAKSHNNKKKPPYWVLQIV